ncbi:hypothetical protein ACQ1P5_11740, partial [Ornithobacterium rhinotracheale]
STCDIFTEENSYIENTPKQVLNIAEEDYINDTYLNRYSDIEFKKVKIGKGKFDLPINGEQTKC